MEVTGRKFSLDISCQGSNEDDEDFYCDPCENEGDKQPAEGFCVDCQEYLCSSCFKMHRRPLPWRHHVLQDKDAMPKTKRKEQLNYECIEPCTQHSTKIIEHYCQTHDQLGCPVCITGYHRTCNNVDYIPHIAGQYKESSEINEIFKSLEGLQEKTDEYTTAATDDRFKVAAQAQKAKERVLQLREDFNSICNRLEDDIETVKESDESKIESCIQTFTGISKKIKTHVAVMEKKRTEMKVSQLFTEAKLAKVSVNEITKEMASARDNAKIRHYEIDFNVEELREGLKLSFHGNKKEAVTSKFCNPLNSQNSLARNVSRHEITSSQQNMFVAPPPPFVPTHYPVPLRPPPFMPQFAFRGQQNIMNTNMQGMPYTRSSSGLPYIPPGPPPFSPFQSTPFVSGSSNQQVFNIQPSQTVQTDRKPILSIFDPISKKDVTAEVCKEAEREHPDSISISKTVEISKVGATLNDLIVKNKKGNKEVIKWIDDNVDDDARKQPRFIRALMTVVCNSAIKGDKGNEKLIPTEMSARYELLQQYFDQESELQAIYAVQAFITQLGHPKGILYELFESLYNKDLISADTFLKWEESKDEPEGKEECLKETVLFFEWLKEPDEES